MARLALALHPLSVCDAVTAIEVEAARGPANLLSLRYIVAGAIGDLLLPPAASPTRGDNLWQHSCFEAFAREEGEAAYREFNFAPSTQWAAYSFDDFRSGMRNAEIATPRIATSSAADRFELRVALDLPANALWRLGLSAVIEEINGRKSYWALAHPPGKADFHHPDCFALSLPPA